MSSFFVTSRMFDRGSKLVHFDEITIPPFSGEGWGGGSCYARESLRGEDPHPALRADLPRRAGEVHRVGGSATLPCLTHARQPDDELREHAGFAVDVDRAAVLLDDDVVAHGEAEAGALAGGLGREEGIEHLVLHVRRNGRTVARDACSESPSPAPACVYGRGVRAKGEPRDDTSSPWPRHYWLM
jgi:hypothetical protein